MHRVPARLLFMCITLAMIKVAVPSGKLKIRFVSYYHRSEKGSNGNFCESISSWIRTSDRCDPKFTICVDALPSRTPSCSLYHKTTGTFYDKSYIAFGDSIGGTTNPLEIRFSDIQSGVHLTVQVEDDDHGNDNDHIDDLSMTFYDLSSAYTRRFTLQNRVTLVVDINIECNWGWHGPTCSHFDHCLRFTCRNEGTCENVPEQNNARCLCKPGFTGQRCETDIDDCSSEPCQNGGWCKDFPNRYLCRCRTGFTGDSCQINEDDCVDHKCLSGGTCIDGTNAYHCLCPEGLTGERCEVNLNDCVDHKCENGATCLDEIAQYSCACPLGISGERCEVNMDDCLNHNCENEATCIDGLAQYSCACPLGFFGERCEKNMDDCLNHNCNNGATCVDGIGDYTCTCPEGFNGRYCAENVEGNLNGSVTLNWMLAVEGSLTKAQSSGIGRAIQEQINSNTSLKNNKIHVHIQNGTTAFGMNGELLTLISMVVRAENLTSEDLLNLLKGATTTLSKTIKEKIYRGDVSEQRAQKNATGLQHKVNSRIFMVLAGVGGLVAICSTIAVVFLYKRMKRSNLQKTEDKKEQEYEEIPFRSTLVDDSIEQPVSDCHQNRCYGLHEDELLPPEYSTLQF